MLWFEVLQSSAAVFIGCAAVVGLIVGSFLNVVIYRLPILELLKFERDCREGLSMEPEPEGAKFNLLVPRSHCPSCGNQLTAIENIPVLSWVALRGKCRCCSEPISARYPLVELGTAVLSGLVAWRFGFSTDTVFALILTWGLVALAGIDADHLFLPDSIVLPLLWLGLLANVDGRFTSLEYAVIGVIGAYVLMKLLALGFKIVSGRDGVGQGDEKMIAMLCAWVGYPSLGMLMAGAAILALCVGIALKLAGRRIPFGPFLAVSGFIVVMLNG